MEDLHKVHELNCEGHPPRIVEEVQDLGKTDMYKCMKLHS